MQDSLSPQSMIWAFSCSMSQENRAAFPSSSSYLRSLTKCWREEKETGDRFLHPATMGRAHSILTSGTVLTHLEHHHLQNLDHVEALSFEFIILTTVCLPLPRHCSVPPNLHLKITFFQFFSFSGLLLWTVAIQGLNSQEKNLSPSLGNKLSQGTNKSESH